MEKPDEGIHRKLQLMKQMLGIGEEILSTKASLEHLETVLSLMRTRSDLYAKQASIDSSIPLVSLEMIGDEVTGANLDKQAVRNLVLQIIEQNKELHAVLTQYQEWIGQQVERCDDTLKANQLYTASEYVKHIPSGIKIDSSL